MRIPDVPEGDLLSNRDKTFSGWNLEGCNVLVLLVDCEVVSWCSLA
jgi:hypothetical protein